MLRLPALLDIIRHVEMGMPKPIWRLPALCVLVSDAIARTRVEDAGEEFDRTRQVILDITGQKELLGRNPVLSRSIRLRNPYVDPMSLIQVDLLRRKRSGGDSDR